MHTTLINWLNDEIERHRAGENSEITSWGRGYENGAMTEAIILKSKIRELVKRNEK